MQPKYRVLLIAADVLCWAGAAASIIVGWPAMEWRGFILAAAVSLLIVARTTPGPSTRRLANIMYQQGVHDTMVKLGVTEHDSNDGTLRAG